MKKLLYSAYIFLVFFSVGCSTRTPPSELPLNEPTLSFVQASSTPTPAIEQQNKNTPTPTIIASTSAAVATVSPAQMKQLESDIPTCMNIDHMSGRKESIVGTILYQKKGNEGLFTLGGNPAEERNLLDLDGQEIYVFGFSPDGKWLAYSPILRAPDKSLIFRQPVIFLINALGEKIEHPFKVQQFQNQITEGYELSAFSGGYWINNQLLFTYLSNEDRTDATKAGFPLPKILDPFIGKWRLKELDSWQDSLKSMVVSFSPDMSRSFYQGRYGLALRDVSDLEKDLILWSNHRYKVTGFSAVRWSPNSSKVVFSGWIPTSRARGTVILSRDGEMLQEIDGSYLGYMGNITWSPNSNYFAFISNFEDGATLFIYNSVTGQFDWRCPLNSNTDTALIWSPDSTLIAFSNEGKIQTINTINGVLKYLGPEGFPVGWSLNYPAAQ